MEGNTTNFINSIGVERLIGSPILIWLIFSIAWRPKNFFFLFNRWLWEEDKMGELFKIFVCLAWRIHKFGKKTKWENYSKYLFVWHGGFITPILKRRRVFLFFFFFFLEGSNVGHNIQFNFCNLLIFILLYNFQNFSSRASIP